MPQLITCPDCERTLRVPDDLLGKKVRCPGCSVMFRAFAGADAIAEEAPADRAAAGEERFADRIRTGRRLAAEDDRLSPRRRDEEDEDDYEDRRPPPRDQKSGWGKVRLGIQLVMIGTWVWLAGVFLGGLGLLLGVVLLGGAVTATSGGLAQGGAGVVLMGAGAIAYLVCNFAEFVLRLVGYGLCMAVPPERDTGLKPLAITAFALGAARALFWVLETVLGGLSMNLMQRSGGGLGAAASLLGLLLTVASFIVFMIFLRSVTLAVRARDLSGSPIAVLIVFACYYIVGGFLGGILVVLAFGSAVFAFQSKTAGGAATTMGAMAIVAVIVIGLLVLLYLGLQVWFILVLQKIRDAVAAYRRKL